AWVKKHHFDNTGTLPEHVGDKNMAHKGHHGKGHSHMGSHHGGHGTGHHGYEKSPGHGGAFSTASNTCSDSSVGKHDHHASAEHHAMNKDVGVSFAHGANRHGVSNNDYDETE